MIKNKKGDLSLSINAIIILILAITMLGLGLSFIRGLFTAAEDKVEEVTSATELVNPPTRDNPVTLTPSEITVRHSKRDKITLAFLNSLGDKKKCQLYVTADDTTPAQKEIGEVFAIKDKADEDANIKDLVIYNKKEHSMDVDQINRWILAVDGSKSVKAGTTTKTEGIYVLRSSMCCVDVTETPTQTCEAAGFVQATKDMIIKVTP
tara:strand:- start:1833 stop:2453 length:621 start_codon:yes stop_codon:yes gene_type:complete